MLLIRKPRMLFGIVLLGLLLPTCTATSIYSPLLRAEPSVDAALTRAPRTLRLYYAALPDVDQSNVTLIGPTGEHQLRGLHTMASDDLMIEIMDPVTEGEYTVRWTTVIGDDPVVYEGSYNFTVRTDQ
ncbi:MAG: copper resistance protein CopC [Proteobacteria bacterium]|nr:copper resistance protein CopC [Pseudomonadota bacterium]